MRFINKCRGTGKTTMMIHSAYTTGYPIIVTTHIRKDYVLQQAHEMNCDGINVYTVDEWNRLRNASHEERQVFVDETEDLLKKILNEYLDANVVAATLSLEMK